MPSPTGRPRERFLPTKHREGHYLNKPNQPTKRLPHGPRPPRRHSSGRRRICALRPPLYRGDRPASARPTASCCRALGRPVVGAAGAVAPTRLRRMTASCVARPRSRMGGSRVVGKLGKPRVAVTSRPFRLPFTGGEPPRRMTCGQACPRVLVWGAPTPTPAVYRGRVVGLGQAALARTVWVGAALRVPSRVSTSSGASLAKSPTSQSRRVSGLMART